MQHLERMYAPFRYRSEVRRLVHLLKFGHERLAADFLARHMANALPDRSFDCIVPLPLHALRQRERGYNQSMLLAERVSAMTGIPVREELLRRVRATRAQSSLAPQERAGNVEKAFQAADAVAGLKILLLDDVRTSGCTANAAAQAMSEKGAAGVSLLTSALVWCWAEHDDNKKKEKRPKVKKTALVVPEADREDEWDE